VSRTVSFDEAVEALKRDPARAVRARIGDMTVEVRVVPAQAPRPSGTAADALRAIGCWEGETHEELVALFANVRQRPSPSEPHMDD
jgi:hypothetical protein